MQLSDSDRDEIARTIIGEAGDQPVEGQAAVAHVILNRMSRPDEFPSSVSGVVHQRNAFEAWSRYPRKDPRHPANYDPSSPEYQKASQIAEAVANGIVPDPTGGAVYFYDPAAQAQFGRKPPSFAQKGPPLTRIGGHLFYPSERPVSSAQPGTSQIAGMDDDEAVKFLNSRRERQRTAPAPNEMSDDDAMKFLEQRRAASPSAPLAPKAVPTESIKLGTSAASSNAPQPPDDGSLASRIRSIRQAIPDPQALVEGMPIIGPASHYLSSAIGAGIQPLLDPNARMTLSRLVTGTAPPTFGERFSKNLEMERGKAKEFAEKHPTEATLSGLLGGTMAMVSAAGTALGARALGLAGSTLGARLYGGAAGGAGIGGLDAQLRGENPAGGAAMGIAGGAGGVLGGEAVGRGVSGLLDMARRGTGPLAGTNSVLRGWLRDALGGETPASLAAAQQRMGPQGFLADVNTPMTELAAGVSRETGLGEAYRVRQSQQRAATEQAVNANIGHPVDIEDFKNAITENRAAAADPLYEQWRSMQVHPTQELKDLYPVLERHGLLDSAQEHADLRGVPFDRNFFTPGQQKNYPTTESWDMIKRAIDSRINKAYSAGDNTLGADYVNLKNRILGAIDNTPAGTVWRQARQEFADRSALLEQIQAGEDTFLGGRSGTSVAQLRQELQGLSQPELQARLVGLRGAVGQIMGDTQHGDGTLIRKLLAPNNEAKLRYMIGDDRTDQLLQTLRQQQFLSEQSRYVNPRAGSPTAPRQAAERALQPPPSQPWELSLSRPFTWIPPRFADTLKPSTVIEGGRAERYRQARQQLGNILGTDAQTGLRGLLDAIDRETAHHASAVRTGQTLRQLVTGATAGPGAQEARRRKPNVPNLMDLISPSPAQ